MNKKQVVTDAMADGQKIQPPIKRKRAIKPKTPAKAPDIVPLVMDDFKQTIQAMKPQKGANLQMIDSYVKSIDKHLGHIKFFVNEIKAEMLK